MLKHEAFDISALNTFFKQIWNLLEIFLSPVNKLLMKFKVIIEEISSSPVNTLIKSSIYDVNLLFN